MSGATEKKSCYGEIEMGKLKEDFYGNSYMAFDHVVLRRTDSRSDRHLDKPPRLYNFSSDLSHDPWPLLPVSLGRRLVGAQGHAPSLCDGKKKTL